MSSPRFRPALLHPRYWLTWLGFLLWYLLALLPYTVQLVLGRLLGKLLYRAAGRRRQIARANLDLCFPDWTQERREQVTREIMESIGIAFFETGMAWFWPKWRLQRLYTVEGLEHLTAARESGVGVVLMAFHFTHIDIGAKLLGLSFSIDGTYRPHNNPVYDYIQRNGRERHSMQGQAIPRDDVRAMVKALRNGRAIWYAPDQDYGAKHSIFVPLFGIPAATVTATSQLARLGKAQVIAFTQTRRADGKGYHLKIYPPLENFPTSDEVADTLRINQFVEARILEQPEQYLWVHRRFKSRPEGEPDLYEQAGVRRKQR
ncbi:MAG: lipid A biosynthesis lauroyl acyltransferase [Cellvibrionaceae bacterium]|nr:lipid A biosynthesis lauroyl acyltransferase [Cellvibrionaceae bacterium]